MRMAFSGNGHAYTNQRYHFTNRGQQYTLPENSIAVQKILPNVWSATYLYYPDEEQDSMFHEGSFVELADRLGSWLSGCEEDKLREVGATLREPAVPSPRRKKIFKSVNAETEASIRADERTRMQLALTASQLVYSLGQMIQRLDDNSVTAARFRLLDL